MIIAIDIDEVLADSITTWRKYVSEEYDIQVTEKELGEIPYLSFIGDTTEQRSERIRVFNDSKYFWENRPLEGAVEAIELLARDHTLKIVTSRPIGIKNQTIEWLERYFPGKFSEIHFNNENSAKTYALGDGVHKGDMLEGIGAEVFLDDYLEYVNGCPKNIRAILFEKPWNQGNIDSNVTRVKGWEEALKII
jgi:uncharacterized HAD superfamily protein